MSSSLDRSVEYIKNIVDFHRCRICDKADGARMRYPCGHTACDDCILEATSCLTCLTPPEAHTYTVVLDDPFTLRAKNALALKKAFEDTFNIDIYKRHRLSELIKVEQELFLSPIKASVKYYNKRKSFQTPSKNNETINIPGEQISPLNKMASGKNSYVQQWLDRIETRPRKPFADLDVNKSLTLQNTSIKRRADLILDKAYEKTSLKVQRTPLKKRTHFKTSLSLVNSQSKLNKYLKPFKKEETAKWNSKKSIKDCNAPEKLLYNKINDKDESGIVMDEEIISINNSPSVIVDKDREAWLAVLRAEETDMNEPTYRLKSAVNRYTLDVENTINQKEKQYTSTYNKIPFIKRSSLSELCQFCNDDTKHDQNLTTGHSKNISITILNNSVITTITVSDNREAGSNTKQYNKQSTYVQTDIQSLLVDQSIITQSNVAHVDKECVKESQDLFTAESPQDETLIDNITVKTSESVQNKITTRIPDSDSDEDLNQSSILQVTADVHRTSDPIDYGVLIELDEKKLELKTKHRKRGKTPASSDSSEKENHDPNKCKRRKLEKKSAKKQKPKRIKSK